MRKIVIAGAEHTGKSTLLDRLQQEFADKVYFIPEPASLLIDIEHRRKASRPDYEGVYPTNNYRKFAELVMTKSVELESSIPSKFGAAILDRCLIDNIAYARMNGCHDLVPHMRTLAVAANYTTVLMCDFVGKYAQTEIRTVDEATAHRLHNHLLEAYSEFDVDIVHLPPVDIENRVAIARSVIE